MVSNETKIISKVDKRTMRLLRSKCPTLLESYNALLKFYMSATSCYTMKVWKDGRVVLTPKS